MILPSLQPSLSLVSFKFSRLPYPTLEITTFPHLLVGNLPKVSLNLSAISEISFLDQQSLLETAALLEQDLVPGYYEDAMDGEQKKGNLTVLLGLPRNKPFMITSLNSPSESPSSKDLDKAPAAVAVLTAPSAPSHIQEKPAPSAAVVQVQKHNIDKDVSVSQSVMSSAVWVPTPGAGAEERDEAALRHSLTEDCEVPLSLLKALLFP